MESNNFEPNCDTRHYTNYDHAIICRNDTLQYVSLFKSKFCLQTECSFLPACLLKRSRDSSVGIANDYGLDDRGVRISVPVV
jgi:hypothetical protein